MCWRQLCGECGTYSPQAVREVPLTYFRFALAVVIATVDLAWRWIKEGKDPRRK
jgi:hypothetical protein